MLYARTRGVVYLGRCSERCRGSAEVRLPRRTARVLAVPVVLGKSHVTLDGQPKSKSLRIRLSRRARQLLSPVRGRLTVTLTLRVADDAGNRTTASRRLKLA